MGTPLVNVEDRETVSPSVLPPGFTQSISSLPASGTLAPVALTPQPRVCPSCEHDFTRFVSTINPKGGESFLRYMCYCHSINTCADCPYCSRLQVSRGDRATSAASTPGSTNGARRGAVCGCPVCQCSCKTKSWKATDKNEAELRKRATAHRQSLERTAQLAQLAASGTPVAAALLQRADPRLLTDILATPVASAPNATQQQANASPLADVLGAPGADARVLRHITLLRSQNVIGRKMAQKLASRYKDSEVKDLLSAFGSQEVRLLRIAAGAVFGSDDRRDDSDSE